MALSHTISFYFTDMTPARLSPILCQNTPENSVFVLISRNGNFRFLAKNWTKIEEFNAY